MRALVLMSLAASLLAGCASPWGTLRLPTGTPREQVLAQAGTPTRVVPLPEGGQRLQYSLQPRGQQAFMVDLDAAGRLVRARQVLTLPEFERIVPGQWSRADVEREFGPPAQVEQVRNWEGPVFTYRWNDGSDMFYWVYLDPQGIVRRAHPGMEFVNAPNDRN